MSSVPAMERKEFVHILSNLSADCITITVDIFNGELRKRLHLWTSSRPRTSSFDCDIRRCMSLGCS